MTIIDSIRRLRTAILAAHAEVAAIKAQGLPAPERSRAITKAAPRGYKAVIDAILAGETGDLSDDVLDAAWEAAQDCGGMNWGSSAAVARFVEVAASL